MSELKHEDIVDLLAEIAPQVDWSSLSADDSLADFGLDSLDKATLFMKIEGKVGISIPDDDYNEMDRTGDIINYINKNR